MTTPKAVLPFFLVLLYFLVSLKKMPIEDALAHVQPPTRQGDTLKPRAAAGRGERVTLPRAQRPRFTQQRRQLRPRPARPRFRRACGSVAWTLRSEGRLQVSPHRPRGHASSVFRRHPRHLCRHQTFEDFRLETGGGGGQVASCRGTQLPRRDSETDSPFRRILVLKPSAVQTGRGLPSRTLLSHGG